MAAKDGIEVFVLAAPGREAITAACRASLEASDIGQAYRWCEHPADLDKLGHWSATFGAMAASEAPQVLLLEDDCLVNAHILQNIRLWSWPDHHEFGAGWLYNPGAYCAGHDVWYSGPPDWYGTVAVLYWREDVALIHALALDWMRRQNSLAWDCAVSHAVHYLNRKIRVHGPPLVEHQHEAPSLLGHTHSWAYGSTRGTYQPNWVAGISAVRDDHTRLDRRTPQAVPPKRTMRAQGPLPELG